VPLAGGEELGCSLCGVKCNSQATLDQHLSSRKHLAKVAKYVLLGSAVQCLCLTSTCPRTSTSPSAWCAVICVTCVTFVPDCQDQCLSSPLYLLLLLLASSCLCVVACRQALAVLDAADEPFLIAASCLPPASCLKHVPPTFLPLCYLIPCFAGKPWPCWMLQNEPCLPPLRAPCLSPTLALGPTHMACAAKSSPQT